MSMAATANYPSRLMKLETEPDERAPLARASFRNGEHEIVGDSQKLCDMMKQVDMVAPTNCTTLIQGETGTGKECVAAMIHTLSPRRSHSLVRVNCAAIPIGLLESELFGHERGAFTGAISQRIGRFEQANKGTIFLDEVGDIPPELQPKLLRVLQEQEFERLGSPHTIHTDVRVVAATHRNLPQMVAEGKFRADLFYRLSVFPIAVPPLRERLEDIPLLVRHFTRKFAEQQGKRIDHIPYAAIEFLVRYSWPGNIRELQNFIERSVILSRGAVLEPPLDELRGKQEIPVEPVTLRDAERAHILRTLQKTSGQLAGAAVLLGVPRSTLFYKIRRLGISASKGPKARTAGASH
ncbi:MAG: Sigma-54 dependent transcriptional regulator (modular protein) [Bryobacterales bacterium]|nr:Sigma-54 dependent transcriptional regulator (modular protein) [Bryobacterales bacterium]